ncbi:crossover junction endodeoxyribonuclease RuvC [Alicyclobacillus vulcanalis]|uniref:Crossover junction endodeoxyribonuclease RuvC n=1 Tax=Alicyclobacillus vulcanalis TaxID=252246 RepID=A0A1N7MR79_9BACL|nr:crossover junction endodeoxyribonuclease RuvC [Alicyclobacillus vulcanalis]SIS88636.1 crossover junction endodeoxyribonuclease RuvC [Alicyclobacillus vulcanalis]
MRILGIDHGTRYAGWAVLDVKGDKHEWLGYGLITLTGEDTLDATMGALHTSVANLIQNYEPTIVALEEPMAMRSGKVARKLIQMYTAARLAAALKHIPILDITPQTLKLYTAGHGAAEKDDVARALVEHYGLDYDEIAVPEYYKSGKRKGELKGRLYDVSDACGLCVAAVRILRDTIKGGGQDAGLDAVNSAGTKRSADTKHSSRRRAQA